MVVPCALGNVILQGVGFFLVVCLENGQKGFTQKLSCFCAYQLFSQLTAILPIRKKLLLRMFQECKTIGGGMDQAQKVVEMVMQITRVGLSGIQ